MKSLMSRREWLPEAQGPMCRYAVSCGVWPLAVFLNVVVSENWGTFWGPYEKGILLLFGAPDFRKPPCHTLGAEWVDGHTNPKP